jgi:hypothetical protein
MNGLRCIIIFAAIGWIALAMSNAGNRAYADAWVDGTPRFRENAIFLARTLGHDVGAMLAPALADALPSAAYKVGDEREFYAINMSNGSQYSLTASCRAVSDKAYIFVENDRPAAFGKIDPLLIAFDRIYDAVTGQFGPPPDSIDGDPRVYILLMDIIDVEQEDGIQTLGYFDAINQYRDDQLPRWIHQRSNEIEMLHIDYKTLDLEPDGAEGIVAHEFTHLVQWARDPEEAIWIDEGIAVYAEAMLGYEVDEFISAFEEAPDTPLLSWFDLLPDYGAAYLFFAYVSERFGGTPAIASIVKSEDQGVKGIEQALGAQGEPVSFSHLFSDWVIANYLDDPDLGDGIYGYAAVDVHVELSVVESLYPIDSKVFVIEPWSAHYIEFDKEQDDALNLTVSNNSLWDDIVAQIIEFGDETSVSSVKSGEVSSGTAFVSQQDQKTILVVASQPDPPESRRRFSSYAYSAEIGSVVPSVVHISDMKITTWGSIKRD